MSVHPRGKRWQVKWRDITGKQHGKTFARKSDALLLDAEMTRARQLGPGLAPAVLGASTTLNAFVTGGFRMHSSTLSANTRGKYAWAMTLHLQEIADIPLRILDVPRLMQHRSFLLENGRTVNTVRDVFTRLSGILQVAVESGELIANPVRSMRSLPAEVKDEVRPLSPEQLEDLLDATTGQARIICVLAGYLGLRPLEARLARWENLNLSTSKLRISRTGTKSTAAKVRVIDVPVAAARELKEWFLAQGRPGGGAIIGTPERDWSKRSLLPPLTKLASDTLGRDDVTLYTLRHTHASLLHYCRGYTVPRAAKRMGHTGKVHLECYAHVIEELDDQQFENLDAVIAHARERGGETGVPVRFPG